MSNNWTSDRSFESKKKATEYAVSYFPNCRGKSIVMMPSTTCFDIQEMYKQNKIDNTTKCDIYDNLKSIDLNEYKKTNFQTKRDYFKQEFKKTLKNIFGDDSFYTYNRKRFRLGINIQEPHRFSQKHFDLIYADTCGQYNEFIAQFINRCTDYLTKGGILAYTTSLNRFTLEGDENYPRSNPKLINLGKYLDTFQNKINIIANDIEKRTKNVLKTKSMIYYHDKSCSNMCILIFYKTK